LAGRPSMIPPDPNSYDPTAAREDLVSKQLARPNTSATEESYSQQSYAQSIDSTLACSSFTYPSSSQNPLFSSAAPVAQLAM
jgi:hypothetical protein